MVLLIQTPWLMKIVAGEETDDQLVYGGTSSRTNPRLFQKMGHRILTTTLNCIKITEHIAQL